MYPYLTGAASWYLLTLVTEVFGVKGALGDLALMPRLVSAQFDATGQASLSTLFAGRLLNVVYLNPAGLDFDAYQVEALTLDGAAIPFERRGEAVVMARQLIAALDARHPHTLEVTLAAKS